MARIIVNDKYLLEIANAIRVKTGYQGSLMPSQFAPILASYYGVNY